MSLEKQIKHNCPHCNTEQNLIIYNSVNVTIEPSLKSKVINGKLNIQQCTNCKKEINIISGFLYHDMENQLMLNFSPDSDADQISKSEMLSELKEKGYIYRIVDSYPALVEKIKLFDLKINDKVVEKVKSELSLMLNSSLNEVVGKTDESEINIFFDKYDKGLFKKKLSFIFFLHPSQIMKIDYNIKKLSKKDRAKIFDLETLRN
ncbi:CpXC domain-containing protein [Psychroserpens sp. S379A]|uniref:CpXC domain-containing protein n=1 Tax=Psychroserpens sp. S379A TaxID=3415137 RepID=UPI003C7CF275